MKHRLLLNITLAYLNYLVCRRVVKMYKTMKKLINNKNAQYRNDEITAEEYQTWKATTMTKLDMFLACDRITADQYGELTDLLKTIEVKQR